MPASPDRHGSLPLDRTALVVLAAGGSTRMGQPKALVSVGGKTLLEHLLAADLLGRLGDVVVVLGHHADRLWPLVERLGARWRLNPEPDRGRMSSVQTGLEGLSPKIEGIFVQGVDCPLVQAATYERLAERLAGDVAIPRFQGRDGHPPLVSTRLVPRISAARADESLRNVLYAQDVRRTHVEIDDPGVLLNIDRPADLAELARLLARR